MNKRRTFPEPAFWNEPPMFHHHLHKNTEVYTTRGPASRRGRGSSAEDRSRHADSFVGNEEALVPNIIWPNEAEAVENMQVHTGNLDRKRGMNILNSLC